jgi:hypothetical protein
MYTPEFTPPTPKPPKWSSTAQCRVSVAALNALGISKLVAYSAVSARFAVIHCADGSSTRTGVQKFAAGGMINAAGPFWAFKKSVELK